MKRERAVGERSLARPLGVPDGFSDGRHNSFNWFLPTQRDFFLFYWAKGSECSASSLLLSQQSP